MLETKIRIFNLFEFPVSLVWIDLEDRPIPRIFVAERLHHKTDLQVGYYFEVVEFGTDFVVDHFFVEQPDEDGEYIYHVGPMIKDPPDFVSVLIHNHLNVPVSLYFLDEMEDEEGNSRFLMHDNIPETFRLKSSIGHRFEVISNETGELIIDWEVVEESDRRMIVHLDDESSYEDNHSMGEPSSSSDHHSDSECLGTIDAEL
jgi:hypothetical protein